MRITHFPIFIAALCCAIAAADQGSLFDQALSELCGAAGCPENSPIVDSIQLNPRLDGEGFHRTLHFLPNLSCSATDVPFEIAIIQPLPAAIYANIYELDDAQKVGQGPKVCLFGKVDVESIEKFSNSTVIVIYAPVLCGSSNTISVPLHARYVRARIPKQTSKNIWDWEEWFNEEIVEIEVPKPVAVLGRCSREDFSYLTVIKEDESGPILWKIPAGNLILANAAAIVTSIVIFLAGAAVVAQAVVVIPSKKKAM